jgi:capsular polysaccharide transport system permease protein
MPETIRDYLDYNPLLHLVEWLRSAYYSSYDEALVDKTLVLGVAASLLALGLAGERFLRGRFYA